MPTTFRDVLNNVMRILRESEISSSVASLPDDYSRLVAGFVNTIKEEVEDAHNWRSLRQQHSVTVAQDAISGSITGANERSRLVRVQDARLWQLVPLVYDVTDPSDPIPVTEMDLSMLLHRDSLDPSARADKAPIFFAIDVSDSVPRLMVWPRPRAARTFAVHMFTPQDRLGDDDLDVALKVPSRPVEVGALWYALEERGEELGINSLFSEERYQKALDDAISRDSAEAGDSYELSPQ